MSEPFTAADVAAARAELGLSRTELAAHLVVPVQAVDAWEDGRSTVPRRYARQLRFEVAHGAQQRALEAAGLPQCEWMAGWERRFEAASDRRATKLLEEVDPHFAGCERCRARDAYARDHLPALPEPPVAGWLAALRWTSRQIERLPAWTRPAVWGALILPAMTVFRAAIEVVITGRLPTPVLVQALAFTAGMGAVLGGVYGGVGALARGRGRVAHYLISLAIIAPPIVGTGVALARDGAVAALPVFLLFVAIALILGVGVGHVHFTRHEGADAAA